MQCKTKKPFFWFCIAEAPPIFDVSQSSESRMQCKTKKHFFDFALLRRLLSSTTVKAVKAEGGLGYQHRETEIQSDCSANMLITNLRIWELYATRKKFQEWYVASDVILQLLSNYSRKFFARVKTISYICGIEAMACCFTASSQESITKKDRIWKRFFGPPWLWFSPFLRMPRRAHLLIF